MGRSQLFLYYKLIATVEGAEDRLTKDRREAVAHQRQGGLVYTRYYREMPYKPGFWTGKWRHVPGTMKHYPPLRTRLFPGYNDPQPCDDCEDGIANVHIEELGVKVCDPCNDKRKIEDRKLYETGAA